MSEAPVLRVVRGDATPEEIAALVGVLSALGDGPAEPQQARPRGWASPAARLRSPAYGRSPGGWRSSALPR
ncbi:MAG: acyl-CoA carboxylase subunit epsilon [Lapillicoccus sp.]